MERPRTIMLVTRPEILCASQKSGGEALTENLPLRLSLSTDLDDLSSTTPQHVL